MLFQGTYGWPAECKDICTVKGIPAVMLARQDPENRTTHSKAAK